MIERLQDWRIILHPDAHQQHHEKFNCNFCILNGWANPLMNRVARLLTHFGVLAEEPPTARNRRERAERPFVSVLGVDGPSRHGGGIL